MNSPKNESAYPKGIHFPVAMAKDNHICDLNKTFIFAGFLKIIEMIVYLFSERVIIPFYNINIFLSVKLFLIFIIGIGCY